jgi:hypothetical protein
MMRLCERCREIGRAACLACVVLVGAHDLHTHEEPKSGPPKVRTVSVVSSTSDTMNVGIWTVVPGKPVQFRVPPSSSETPDG